MKWCNSENMKGSIARKWHEINMSWHGGGGGGGVSGTNGPGTRKWRSSKIIPSCPQLCPPTPPRNFFLSRGVGGWPSEGLMRFPRGQKWSLLAFGQKISDYFWPPDGFLWAGEVMCSFLIPQKALWGLLCETSLVPRTPPGVAAGTGGSTLEDCPLVPTTQECHCMSETRGKSYFQFKTKTKEYMNYFLLVNVLYSQ